MDIDVVLPWVDGNDPAHAKKRAEFSGHYKAEDPAIGASEVSGNIRWQCAEEIRYALRSIERNLSFVRRVWIITDGQAPPLQDLSPDFQRRVVVVDHRDAFGKHCDLLPCFNSAAIETPAALLEDVADHVILSNDDVFFTQPSQPDDFFLPDGRVKLRGTFDGGFMDYATMWGWHTRNGARLAGIPQDQMLTPAHCAQPIDMRMVREFLKRNPLLLRSNLSYRFRDQAQFTLSSLATHLSILAGRATLLDQQDWYHIPAGKMRTVPMGRLRKRLNIALLERHRLVCLNDLAGLLERMPDARGLLDDHFGIDRDADGAATRKVA